MYAPIDLIILSMAAWRLAAMLTGEDGPFHVFDHLRRVANRWTVTGELLACIYCTSVWSAALMLLIWPLHIGQVAAFVLALSAAAIIIHRVTERAS
jgi:hypothetical protein